MSTTLASQVPVFIYLHGFNSSPLSQKGQLMAQYLESNPELGEFWAPDLSHWPQRAVEQVAAKLATYDPERPVLLVGSSLGGYYATALLERLVADRPALRAVLVNPAVYPYRLLRAWLGLNENYHTADHYELTHEHLHQLEALDCPQLKDPTRYLVLLQSGDETLDYHEALAKYGASPLFVEQGGCHGFTGFDRLLPSLVEFAHGRLRLPEPQILPPGADSVN